MKQGKHYTPDESVQIEPGTGSVQIQLLRTDGNVWYAPASFNYTISTDSVIKIIRRNAPAVRIIATGNARFTLSGSVT